MKADPTIKKPGAKPGNKNALGNAGGRPSKYSSSFDRMAYELCMVGYTDQDLARFFDVAESTINEWKKSKVEFSEALKMGKDTADGKVAVKLYERALGYSHPDIDIRVV